MAATEPPPPMDPRIPRGLQAAVLRCLEKDRKGRFSSVAALATALAPFARDQRAAPVIVDRTNSMLPVAPKAHDVTASHAAQDPTTAHQRGQVTASSPTSSSAVRWGIIGGLTLVAVIVAATLIDSQSTHDAAKPAAPSTESAVLARPDASVASAAVVEAPAPPSHEVDAGRKQTECLELRAAKKWQDLLGCGKALSQVGSSRGDEFQQVAQSETKNEEAAHAIDQKIVTGELRDAQGLLKTFSANSVYFRDLSESFDRADAVNVREQTRRANVLLAAKNCDGIKQLLSQEATAATGTQAAIAAVAAVSGKCTAQRTAAAQAQLASASARATPPIPLPSPPSQPGQAAVPAPAPKCDPAIVDDWVAQATNLYVNGYPSNALELIVKALGCKSEIRLYRFAATYACAAQDATAARFYFDRVPPTYQAPIQQKCQMSHTDLGIVPR